MTLYNDQYKNYCFTAFQNENKSTSMAVKWSALLTFLERLTHLDGWLSAFLIFYEI